MESMKNMIDRAMQNAKLACDRQKTVYRFDIFKGVETSEGKVQKIRSLGSAQLLEGTKTYTVYLKPLLKDVFYLLPEEKRLTRGDYAILTREDSKTPGRKFYWNNVGECFLMSGANSGLMHLKFDLFGADDVYMNLQPINRAGGVVAESETLAVAA